MIIRQIKENHWQHVYRQITTYGRAAPMCLQLDIDLNCNGVDYVLRVQPEKDRKIVALQAMGVYPDGEREGGREYHLIENNAMLSALLEIIVYQGAAKRRTEDVHLRTEAAR